MMRLSLREGDRDIIVISHEGEPPVSDRTIDELRGEGEPNDELSTRDTHAQSRIRTSDLSDGRQVA